MLKTLPAYINNPTDPETNWQLALEYQSLGHTAAALSFFLRTAERSEDNPLLQYEALIRGSRCYTDQGRRGISVRGLLQHAISIFPRRPEAYYLYAIQCEKDDKFPNTFFDSYLMCSIALDVCDPDENLYPLRTDVGYPGRFAILFQKGHVAWHTGRCDESRDIFIDLIENYNMPQHFIDLAKQNFQTITNSFYNAHKHYDSPKKRKFEEYIHPELKDFDWGENIKASPWFRQTVTKEIFVDDIYQKYFQVDRGDLVLDIGASVGPFTHHIQQNQPGRVICLEPHKDLFKTLTNNTEKYSNVIRINKGIGQCDGTEIQRGLFNEKFIEILPEKNSQEIDTISFSSLRNVYGIGRIDFMKIDCEGGEYDIFTEENAEWIKSNIKKIAGEWHLSTPELKEKFRKFRDIYLTENDTFIVEAVNQVDITSEINSDQFIDYYAVVNLYIDNRKNVKPEKWKYSIAPTMEVTTTIPSKGCVVDCVFCPQRTLIDVYKGERRMTLDNFKRAVDKIPKDVRITFAGFTEPWLHSQCTDMVLYAHETGHPVSIFTTAVGMTVEDIDRIKHIPFAGDPNGNFTLHLPDQGRKAKHPINKNFIEVIEHFGKVYNEIQNFRIMVMEGDVHESVRHVFPEAPSYAMWSRAGNLLGESMLKPELLNERYNSVYHQETNMTCGCDERLYHNVMLPNGDVALCCMDYGLDHIIGNIFTQSYEDVIPEPYQCFELCKFCENAVCLNNKNIQAEIESYGLEVNYADPNVILKG